MMLDDYIDEQKIAYTIFKNAIKKNKCSHAYLIESNGYSKTMDFVLSVAKALLCPKNLTSNILCKNCNQCKLISDNNFLELKIVYPEGEWIKKEQLDQLQELFSKKAIIGNKKIYIIDSVERLNISSANSILKFLEEPEQGIYAFLITNNINNVINTIVSRCQVISLKKGRNKQEELKEDFLYTLANSIFNSESKINDFINNERNKIIVKSVIDFVNFYEDNHIDTFFELNNLWNNNIVDRQDYSTAFNVMLLYYKDILNYKNNLDLEIFNQDKENIKKISIKNSIEKIINKINIIIDLQDKIKYNINVNLLMDKLLLCFEGCE